MRFSALIAVLSLSACGVDTSPVDGPWRAPGQEASVARLSAGDAHLCATSADGSMTCWGDNRRGQLGGRIAPASASPINVGGSDVVLVEAGHESTCRATRRGSVDCFGRLDPFTLSAGPPVIDIAVARGGFCVVREGGTVECAGDAPWLERFRPGGDQAALGASAIAARGDRVCAARGSEPVACWGRGWATDGNVYDFARDVDGSDGAVDLALGDDHGCLLSDDGRVRCWGDNARGQLGAGSTPYSLRALTVPLSRAATGLAAGPLRSCAVVDAEAFCWGANQNGLLGDGSTDDATSPTPVALVRDLIGLALGRDASCAQVRSGHAVCWGSDTLGQLGRDEPLAVPEPVRIAALPRASSIGVGLDHLCVAAQDGDVWCLGRGDAGQLGDGLTTDAPSAIRADVPTLTDRVGAWGDTSCAYEADGSEDCWGALQPPPELVAPPLAGLDPVRYEDGHGCGIDAAGGVRCWGMDAFGELGPAAVVELPAPATDVDVGPDASCAVVQGGDVWCWGRVAFATGRVRRAPAAVLDLP